MKRIPLTAGKFALVDDEDFDFLNQWKWHARKKKNNYYAERSEHISGAYKHKTVAMHRLIANTPQGLVTDHTDHNTLNNQRNNLRTCTHKQNMANISSHRDAASKYVGVSFESKTKKWRAHIKINGVKKALGRFKTQEEAAVTYNNIAIKERGEFANLNIVNESN